MSPSVLSLAAAALAVASSAMAAPNPAPVEKRQGTPTAFGGPGITPGANLAANANSDFAGVALQASPSETFTSVTATFTLPSASTPPGGNSNTDYNMAVWAGIQGGYAANEGLLQSGCTINSKLTQDNGQKNNQCWVEYYPNPAIFIDIYPEAGQRVAVGVKALSPTKGSITIQNVDTGKSFTTTMTAPSPSNTILGAGNVAEFLLESTANELIPKYSPQISYTNANVYNKAGSLISLAGAPVSNINFNGKQYTNAADSAHGVTIPYTG